MSQPEQRTSDELLQKVRCELGYIAGTLQGIHHEKGDDTLECWCGWCASVRTAKEAIALLDGESK